MCTRCFPELSLRENIEVLVSLDCIWESKMLEMPRSGDTCQGKLKTRCGSSWREKYVTVNKAAWIWDLKSPLASSIEMKNLEFTLLVLGFTLLQYFLTLLPCVYFRKLVHILCVCVLEVWDLPFDFWFYTLLQLRDCLFSEETMSFGLLNRAKTMIDFGDFEVVLNEVL